MTPYISCRSLIQIGLQILRWRAKGGPCKALAVSQAFIFHFKCYSILQFAACQLLGWAFFVIIYGTSFVAHYVKLSTFIDWLLCNYFSVIVSGSVTRHQKFTLISDRNISLKTLKNDLRVIEQVMQIFYPYSMQLYSNEFPGNDPRDCTKDVNKTSIKYIYSFLQKTLDFLFMNIMCSLKK